MNVTFLELWWYACQKVSWMIFSVKWLEQFTSSVSDRVKLLLVLVYDGRSSQYNAEVVAQAVYLKVIIFLLPANSTHFIQTLDTSVFLF